MLVPYFFLENDFSKHIDLITKHSYSHMQIPKGTILHDAQNDGKTSYYINNGLASLNMINEEGTEQIMFFLGSGSIYPIDTLPVSLTMDEFLHFVAITDLDVYKFPSKDILKMTSESNDFTSSVIQHYNRYTNIMLCKVLFDSYNDSKKCVCSFLYLYKCYYKSSFLPDLNQEEIAKLLGLSRIQVSRILSSLRNENIIDTGRNSILVKNANKLLELSSEIVKDFT